MRDPLSDLLRSVRLSGGVFLDARFTAPWCVVAQITSEDCAPFLDSPAQIIAYHYVIEGTMRVELDGEPVTEVGEGEAVMLPRNDRHLLSGGPATRPVAADDLIAAPGQDGLSRIDHGGGGARTRLVCGFLGTDDEHNPLIDTLPPMLRVSLRDGLEREWVETSVRYAAEELAEGRFATSDAMSRLSELLFVEAVRDYARSLGDENAGWLLGQRDPQVGRALALMHRRLAHPWTAEELAREVALSRSAFVERFTTLVGMPPIRYLTQWRLQTARQRLRESGATIAQVAYAVGYGSEEAFSRAFKRHFGSAPATWRDQAARTGV